MDSEIGLLAIAFGPEAQPEKSDSEQLSLVNLADFDASLISNKQAVLHRVYRYGAAGGRVVRPRRTGRLGGASDQSTSVVTW
ncbi:MAG: hypothetical protein R3C56_17290 [Pirellulaceae bacterium]